MSGETVDVPKVGPVKKGPLFAVLGAGLAYVLWRRYQAQQAAATSSADTSGQFGDAGSIPAVDGAYTGQQVGLPDNSTPPTSGDYGFTGTTNSQWSQYAALQLSESGSLDYTDVLLTLGKYLSGAPLDSQQQSVVQAAIAVAGYPPEGSHPIVPGGGTAMLVAPGSLRGSASLTAVTLSWGSVAGASEYRVYQDGQPVHDTGGLSATISGLNSDRSYSWAVAALTGAGNEGPKSSAITVRTLKPTQPAPTTGPIMGPSASGGTAIKRK